MARAAGGGDTCGYQLNIAFGSGRMATDSDWASNILAESQPRSILDGEAMPPGKIDIGSCRDPYAR